MSDTRLYYTGNSPFDEFAAKHVKVECLVGCLFWRSMLITDYYFIIRNPNIIALTFDADFRILYDLGDREFTLEALAFCFSGVPKCLVL
jgi:hypothetical protein